MRRARVITVALLTAAILVAAASPAPATQRPSHVHLDHRGASTAEPWWERRIDTIVGGRQVSVTIGDDGTFWYHHLASVTRAPASNEKLLLSMALLSTVGPDAVIPTRAMARKAPTDGVVAGNLWLVGDGDPEVGPARLDALARQVVAAGVSRVEGSVVGDLGPFHRDWWSDGWKPYFPADEVAIPTALTFRGNVGPQRTHIDDPELRAATDLTKALRRRGVRVVGDPRASVPKGSLVAIAEVSSAPIVEILRRMNVDSINFDAEVLGKYLGAETSHVGSIPAAAEAIHAYIAASGVRGFVQHDASGLSYADRVTTQGLVRLLWIADQQSWASDLRGSLPIGGQGTLEGRLGHVRVRAKTGTLTDISALSGWAWSKKAAGWVEFSILSAGMGKEEAIRIEDAIVGLVSAHAGSPGGT